MRTIDHVLARPAVPIAAGAVVLVLGLLALGGAALVARGAPSPGFSTVVVPPRADQAAGATGTTQAGAPAAGAPAASGSAAIASDRAGVAAPTLAQGGPTSSAIVGPSCSAAPTVQFQGRGLAATGTALISPSDSSTMALTVNVQQTGTDAAAVIAGVQAKLSAVEAVLQKAGVPAGSIQRSYFSTYGSPLQKQFSAYAAIVAQVGANQLADASRAVLQIEGISGYSTSTSFSSPPSQEELKSATAQATSQATEMAVSMADTAGVTLGSLVSVVTQPPTVCSGGGVPSRMVQVTVTYALR